MKFYNLATFFCLSGYDFTAASLLPPVETHKTGHWTPKTLRRISRGLHAVRADKDHVSFKSNKTVLDTTWIGATLLKQGLSTKVKRNAAGLSTDFAVEITCDKCYIKGVFSASLIIKGNATDILSDYTAQVKDTVMNVTESVSKQIMDTAQDTVQDVLSGHIFDSNDKIQFPTLDVDFDLHLAPLPAITARFEFDEDFEVYMLLDTKLAVGATYTLNMFSSTSPLGVAIGNDITAGVAVVIDLILDVRTAVNVRSGFHMRLNKGVGVELDMFSPNVSGLVFPGGKFEFLPVTLLSDGAVLTGILRVALKAGLEFDSSLLNSTLLPLGAGISAEVFTNIAEFTTNITSSDLSSNKTSKPDKVDECDLRVIENYQFALGAAAGATVAVAGHTWGPTPATTVPIFYTTLTSACVTRGIPVTSLAASSQTISSTSSSTSRNVLEKIFGRSTALTTTTLLSTATFTAQTCRSSGVVNCPASLQASTTYTSVLTHITAVPDGADPTFPITKVTSVEKVVAFGTTVGEMISSTGEPVSYVPPPPPPPPTPPTSSSVTASSTGVSLPGASEIVSDVKDAVGEARGWLDGTTNGTSNRTVLGLVLGLMLPGLASMVWGVLYFVKRNRYAKIQGSTGGKAYILQSIRHVWAQISGWWVRRPSMER